MADNNIQDPRTLGVDGLKGINRKKASLGLFGQDYASSIQSLKYNYATSNLSGVGINYNTDYGASIFDDNVKTLEDLNDLNEVRANNLGTIAKLGAGALKAVTTAATTMADGTVGLVYGLAAVAKSAITEDKPWYEDIAKIWDNKFSNSMREVGELMELTLPNYQTKEEQLNEWWLNVGTANFWADFIKLIGFTVGAYHSGAAWNSALKGLGLLKKAGTAGKLGAALSAVNEGRIEANNNANDWEKAQYAELEPKYRALYDAILAEEDVFIRDPEGNMISNKYLKLKQLEENLKLEKQNIKSRKTEMGNWILAFNTPLLMASNLIQFDKLYQAGFNSSKRAAGTAYKEGNKYFWKNLTTKDALKEGGKRFISEGLEEMSLMWISEGAGIALQYDSPDAYYKALTDPKAEKQTKGFIKGVTEGFMNSYGDLSKYQDFVMGGLTGLLGTPTFGKSLNSSSETYLGKGKTIGLSGGFFGAWKANNETNRVGNLAVEGINKYLLNTAKRARHLVAENYFTDAMDGWSADNNSFEYHNASDNAEFNAIDNFALVGLLDDYKELIDRDFDSATQEDLIEIAESTKNQLTGEYLFLDATGQSLAVSNPELMRLKLNEKKQRLIEGVDAYEKYLALMRAYSNIKDNDDAIRELAWLRWKIDRFLGRKETLTKEQSDFIDTLVGSLARSLHDLELELRDIETANPEDLTEEDKKVLKENKQRLLNISAISNILKEWKEGRFYNTLSKESLDFLLEQDFQTLYAYDNDLDYATYRESMLSIIDLLALNNLLKLFLDKLLYYLDESNLIEEKINNDHAERDNQVAEDNAIHQALETQERVNNILTQLDLDNAVLNYGLETVNAIIDDIAQTESNHPAVLRLLIELTLDTIFDSMNDTLQDYPELWLTIKNMATLSNTLEELKDILLNGRADNAIGQAIGFNIYSPLVTLSDRFIKQVGAIKLQLSDLFNKNIEDTNTSQQLANSTPVTPSTTPQLTTGSDDNVSNDTSLTTPNTNTTDELILQSIDKWKKQGIGDNLIILKGVDAGIPKERMLELMDIYNEANKPVTEEEGAITPTYTSEQGTNVETTTLQLTELKSEEPKGLIPTYNFFKPNTTEYPIHLTLLERNEAFNYDAWVDSLNWSPRLKQSLKVRHRVLLQHDAYTRVSHGELLDSLANNPTEVSLVTYHDINEEANDLVVFLVDNEGHIIGDLCSPIDTTTMRKLEGMEALLRDIEAKYKENNELDYTYPIKTHIDKIMVGRPLYTVPVHTIGEINPNLNLGICTNESLKTIVSASSDKAPIVDKDNILAPLNPKKGLIYVLLPNGRKGIGYQGYTPVLCTTPRLGNEIANTIIREIIVECLTKMTQAKDFGLLLTAFTLLDDYLWIPDLMVNAFNGKDVLKSGDNRPITEVVIKRRLNPNNKQSELQTVIKFNPNGPNALKNVMQALVGTPIHINIKFLNTEAGRKMYNEIVRTNLPIGTETTINDWFTINPIIDGKELKAESPRTTGVNPNVHTSSTTIPYKDGTMTLDYANNKVLVNNVEQLPLATENPLHLTSDINRAYAKMFIDMNPNARLVNGIIETPYGWYDVANKKLVTEPVVELPLQKIGGFTKESSEDLSQSSSLAVLLILLLEVDLNYLGKGIINGLEREIYKLDLEEALDFLGNEVTYNSPIEDIAKFIERFENSNYRETKTSTEPYTKFDKEKELKWLSRVLPLLSELDRVLLVDGLINHRAWGMFSNGIMYLSNEAAVGTTYHEAFHAVTLTLLSEKELNSLYNTAKKVYGEKSNRELEETLAEDFRRYTLLNEQPDSRLKKFFTRLWNNIKAIFSNKAKLEKLFYDINLGIYADVSLKISDGEFYRLREDIKAEAIDLKLKWAKVKQDNIRFKTEEEALKYINDNHYNKVAYVDYLHGVYHVRPIALFESKKHQSLEDLLNPLRKEYLYNNTEYNDSTMFDSLDSEAQIEILNNFTQEQWNDLTYEERELFLHCRGV